MSVPRRRRGDFVRATASVLTTIGSDGLLSADSAKGICDIAVATCGAWRGGIYVLYAYGRPDAKLVPVAESEYVDHKGAAPLADRLSADLLHSALAEEGPLVFAD